ncbi:DegT/DnrJ/EryC1/StrS family aminotransferase [Dinghuibacter silviterrae]|uniref:dTDP-4-amino-4,6-dideoxygalactose transaminase n=1 Tax=Dinghuibacter silviterrae TaxID=1539049 RepID=A0A4R8DRQ6_9BACT|nr:DegT/DnrJ/EryC1/StrS family aminotransferase [Dinghuibacter silviterrae]TDX00037.1 dTDP-4-amino-4,6-dideoxygalactose transaminase [Dinghuibacter silviterrae]
MNIPYLSFTGMHDSIREEMHQAFSAVYDSHWYVLGKKVEAFESQYAGFNGTAFCKGLSNGLDALHLSLKVLGVGPGDEVIVPSNTYIATVLAVSYTGATPVFSEPDPGTYNLDPVRVAEAITGKTKVILPVHLYGQACDMQAIMDLAARHHISVVEDNAQAHGAAFNGKLTGAWGHINATSFYPGKNLGALGDGGAITTNDPELARKAEILRNYGSQKKYFNEVIGHNMRLDELQAALLSVKLPYLKKWTEARQTLAEGYTQRLQGAGDLVLPVTAPGATHVYHVYMVRTRQRDALQAFLQDKGIGTLIHYPLPPHLQEAYRFLGYQQGDFPIAETIAGTCLSLPLWPGMTEAALDEVAGQIHTFFKTHRS